MNCGGHKAVGGGVGAVIVNGGAGGNVADPEIKVCADGADSEGSGNG